MAYPNDMSKIAGAVGILEGASNLYAKTPREASRNLIRRTHSVRVTAADGMASTATAYTAAPMLRARCAGRLLGAAFIPEAAVTANDTNYATLQAIKADGLGGAAVVMAQQTTQITGGGGNFSAGVPVVLPLSATLANQRYAAGQILGLTTTKTGTGVVLPAGTYIFDVEEESVDGYGV